MMLLYFIDRLYQQFFYFSIVRLIFVCHIGIISFVIVFADKIFLQKGKLYEKDWCN